MGNQYEEKRKNSRGEKNTSDKLLIRYDVGSIYSHTKVGKSLGLIGNFVEWTFGGGWLGTDAGSGATASYTLSHPYVADAYHSEYFAYHTSNKGKGGDGYTHIVGNFIHPFFWAKGNYKDRETWDNVDTNDGKPFEAIPCLQQRNKIFEVDTHGLASHYLYNHCYYYFEVLGENIAQMYGIQKLRNGNFGFKWGAAINVGVSWELFVNIVYGQYVEEIVFKSVAKEELSHSDGGMTKWLVKAVATMATGVGAAALGGVEGMAQAQVTGDAMIKSAVDKKNYFETTTFREHTGNPNERDVIMGSNPVDEIRIGLNEGYAQKLNEEAWANTVKDVNSSVSKGVGKSFSGLPRTFAGGKGSYDGTISEFLNTKANRSLLYVECRTGESYQNLWNCEMNRRISEWDFWFGKDPEISLRHNFGRVKGKGYEEVDVRDAVTRETKKIERGVLKDLHGWIQLGENTIFGGKLNPFIEEWIKMDKFVLQLRTKNRPRLVENSFYTGFKGNIDFGDTNSGSSVSLNKERREMAVTDSKTLCSSGFGFAGFWCDGGAIKVGKDSNSSFIVGEVQSSFGSYGNGLTGGDNGNLFYFNNNLSEKVDCGWDDPKYAKYKGKPYQRINFGLADDEFEFGRGSSVIIARYLRSNSREEEVYETDNPSETTWLLKQDKTVYSSGFLLYKRVKGIQTLVQRVQQSFNPSGLQWTIQISGTSGIEGWGNNPPDTFSGGSDGGGTPINIPNWAQNLSSGGMNISNTNPLGVNINAMPTEIQSMVNTQQVFTPLDMPQLNPLQGMMNMNQEGLSNTLGNQENLHQGLHDKVRGEEKKDKTGVNN